MRYKPPKGTQDLWGDKFYAYDFIAQTILKVTEKYGFRQIRTPGFEPIDILAKDAGNEVTGQIYTFKDKGGRDFGIKSDITPGVTRFVAGNGRPMPKPIKITCFDRVYRYERPQSGRNREITQVNVEMYGVKSEIADADVLACFYQCYVELGLPRVEIQIGFRPFLERYIQLLGVDEAQVLPVIRLIDKREKISEEDFISGLNLCGVSKAGLAKINKLLKLSGDSKQVISGLQSLVSGDQKLNDYLEWLSKLTILLEEYGIGQNFKLNLGLARGSEYYTGIIFEAKLPGSQYGSIGGGGRYDNLVARYGGADTAAVGFSIGIDRVYLVLEELNKIARIKKPNAEYYFASETDELSISTMLRYAQALRDKGKNVEVDLQGKNMSSQLQSAKELSVRKVVLFKKSELTKKKVVMLDLENDTESKLEISKLENKLS